jgi:phosphotransferase system IIB component
VDPAIAPQLLGALGGRGNIQQLEAFNSRLSLHLKDPALINESELLEAGFRGVAKLGDGKVQVLANGDVTKLTGRLNADLK